MDHQAPVDAQTDAGISVLRIGQTINSGPCRSTAASISGADPTTATVTSCPSAVNSVSRR